MMRWVIYSIEDSGYHVNVSYITVLDTLEEATALKERLNNTGFWFNGVLFVGDEDALGELENSQMNWWPKDYTRFQEFYPLLWDILQEYNFFGAEKKF